MREVPVAPKHGEIALFASSALLIQENLDLLMAIRSQRHEEVVHLVCMRLPKTDPEQKKNRFAFRKVKSSVSIAPARADRESGIAGNHKNAK